MQRPGVGVGVVILNDKNEVLIGKRKGSLAPLYSIPGGHLELGETFEAAAAKEVYEETGLRVRNLKVYAVSNNLDTYKKENKHYVSINLFTRDFEGTPELKEPDKCEGWFWCKLNDIPSPHFDASAFAIECFLKEVFYLTDIKKEN